MLLGRILGRVLGRIVDRVLGRVWGVLVTVLDLVCRHGVLGMFYFCAPGILGGFCFSSDLMHLVPDIAAHTLGEVEY